MRVLEQTKWRIEGPKGAALILGLHPSTVRSRMLKLGIRKENGTRTTRSESQNSTIKMSKTKAAIAIVDEIRRIRTFVETATRGRTSPN